MRNNEINKLWSWSALWFLMLVNELLLTYRIKFGKRITGTSTGNYSASLLIKLLLFQLTRLTICTRSTHFSTGKLTLWARLRSLIELMLHLFDRARRQIMYENSSWKYKKNVCFPKNPWIYCSALTSMKIIHGRQRAKSLANDCILDHRELCLHIHPRSIKL